MIHRLPGLIITNAVRDPLGSAAAIVMLIWIIVSLLGVIFVLLRNDEAYNGPRREWAILSEVVIGVGVAGYLTIWAAVSADQPPLFDVWRELES